jgi:hypothetical protein
MKRLSELVCLTVCYFAIAAVAQGRAEAAYWHTTASGCTWMVESGKQSPVTSTDLAGILFSGTTTGDIRLYCPITAVNLNGTTPHLGFYSYDDSASNSITVTVKRMAKTASATVTNVCAGSTDDSGWQFKSVAPSGSCFASAIDTGGFVYFAIIDIHRGTSAKTVTALALELY